MLVLQMYVRVRVSMLLATSVMVSSVVKNILSH
jgi:hypothetical protein